MRFEHDRRRAGGMPKTVEIDYTNWRGERRWRKIEPRGLYWGSNEWHRESQWLLIAKDMITGEARTFAMKDIHEWKDPNVVAPKPEKTLPSKGG